MTKPPVTAAVAVVTVKKFRKENVFVFEDLRFSTLSSDTLIGGDMCILDIRVYRNKRLRGVITGMSHPAGMGETTDFRAPPSLGGYSGRLSPETFRVDDILRIEMPPEQLRARILNRLRELQEFTSPWGKRFNDLRGKSIECENRLFRKHKRRITRAFEAGQKKIHARHKAAENRLEKLFLAANPVPPVIRLENY